MSEKIEKGKIIQILLVILVLLGLFYIATRGDDTPAESVTIEPVVLEEEVEEVVEEVVEDVATTTAEVVTAEAVEVPEPSVAPTPVSTWNEDAPSKVDITAIATVIMMTDAEILEALKPLLIEIIKELNILVAQLITYRDQVYRERGIPLPGE